jgi:SAM-dependent methyltransferase
MPERRWSATDLAEAFHLAHAVSYLVDAGLLGDTEDPVDELAAARGLDPVVLGGMLEFLAARTDLVSRGGTGFRAGPGLGPAERGVIDQYLGAYGPNAAALPDILSGAVNGRALTDRVRHARAYAGTSGASAVLLPDLLGKLGLDHVLDLGCGSGELLAELAGRDPAFHGHGVDASAGMIDVARARDLPADRVRFSVGDVTDPQSCVPDDVRADAEVLVASSLLNEFFGTSGAAAGWLRLLGEAFPGRLLVVVDYYGVLGHSAQPPPQLALHDWIQLISAQGVPPPNLDGWQSVYREADCRLLHAIQDSKTGVFIHLVRLPPSRRSGGPVAGGSTVEIAHPDAEAGTVQLTTSDVIA